MLAACRGFYDRRRAVILGEKDELASMPEPLIVFRRAQKREPARKAMCCGYDVRCVVYGRGGRFYIDASPLRRAASFASGKFGLLQFGELNGEPALK